jgi:flagellar basal body-associated protein FliL
MGRVSLWAKKLKTKQKRREKTKKKSKFTLALIIVSVTFFIISAGGGLSFYMGWVLAILEWERPQSSAQLSLGKPVFFPLPEIRIDLKTNECRAPFMRTVIHVQLSPDDVSRLEDNQDLVMDGILTHLRGQERQHLVGKEGSERLRFELVQVIENKLMPISVHTVLFKELVIQ